MSSKASAPEVSDATTRKELYFLFFPSRSLSVNHRPREFSPRRQSSQGAV
jgi:hypothetical protein